jgi:hypothetical protein
VFIKENILTNLLSGMFKLIVICTLLYIMTVYGHSVVQRYPFPNNTPSCLATDVPNRSDVALVYYPTMPGSRCNDSSGKISSNSVWFGYRFGVCHQDSVCGLDCNCLASCGSKGYTMDEFNACYNATCHSCEPITNYVKITPDPYNPNGQIIANFYFDSACNNPKAGNSSSDYYRLNECNGDWFGCDYGTTMWTKLDCSSPSPSNPDTSSSSQLELFF